MNWRGLLTSGLGIGTALLQNQGPGKAQTIGNVLAASMAGIQAISESMTVPLTGEQKSAIVLGAIVNTFNAEAAALGKQVTIDPVLVQNAMTSIAALENSVAVQLHG